MIDNNTLSKNLVINSHDDNTIYGKIKKATINRGGKIHEKDIASAFESYDKVVGKGGGDDPQGDKTYIIPEQTVTFNQTYGSDSAAIATNINYDALDSSLDYVAVSTVEGTEYPMNAKMYIHDRTGDYIFYEPDRGMTLLGIRADRSGMIFGEFTLDQQVILTVYIKPVEVPVLPVVTQMNNGQVLKVINGEWKAWDLSTDIGNIVIPKQEITLELDSENNGCRGEVNIPNGIDYRSYESGEPPKSTWFTVQYTEPEYEYPNTYLFKPVVDEGSTVIFDYSGNCPFTFTPAQTFGAPWTIEFSEWNLPSGPITLFGYQEYQEVVSCYALRDVYGGDTITGINHDLIGDPGYDSGAILTALENGVPVGVSFYDSLSSMLVPATIVHSARSSGQGHGGSITIMYYTMSGDTATPHTVTFTSTSDYNGFNYYESNDDSAA